MVADHKAAFRQHTRQYQRVLSCVSAEAHVRYVPLPGGAEAVIHVSPNPLTITTRAGQKLLLHLRFGAQLDPAEPGARCSRYTIQIHDAEDKELGAWHSSHDEPHSMPHAHISVPDGLLHKKKLPTGFIELADVVFLLLDQLDVVPKQRDWREILRPLPS